MGIFEVTAPDGKVFEVTAPDGASQDEILAYAKQNFAQSTKSSDPLVDGGEQLVRGINRGVNSIVSLPGEIVGGVADMMGADGDKFRWNNPVSDFMKSSDRPPQTTIGRYANASGQAIGASALPTAGMMAAAPRLAAAVPKTVTQAMAQRVAQPFAQAPGAALAAEGTAAAGGGAASEYARADGYGPVGQTVAGVAGAIAPGALLAGTSGMVNQMRKAAARQGTTGAYSAVAESLPGTVDDLGRSISAGGGAASPPREIALRILGEEMVAAKGNVAQAKAAAIPRIASEVSDVRGRPIAPSTAENYIREIQSQNSSSPLMLGEQPSIASADDALRGPGGGLRRPENVDVEGLNRSEETSTQGIFDYLASSGNTQSAVRTRQALNQRGEMLSPGVRTALQDLGPRAPGTKQPATIVDASDMIDNATTKGTAAYKVAERGPINQQLADSTVPRILQRYEAAAGMRAADKREAMLNALKQFYVPGQDGPVPMTTLKGLQDARGAVRGQITGYVTAGRKDLVQAVQPLYDHITRLMTAMSPEWAKANKLWSDMNFDVLGKELGESFSQRAGPQFRKQLAVYDGLHPEAQDIVKIHVLQNLYDKLDNLPDPHSVSKLFNNDHQRNAISKLFGEQARNDFTRVIRNTKTAERSFQMNSRTHIRGEVKEQMEGDHSVDAARNLMSVGGIRDWALQTAKRLLVERKNRPMADIITTPVSDTPRTAMQLQLMRQNQERMRQFAQPQINSQGALAAGGVSALPYADWQRQQAENQQVKSDVSDYQTPPVYQSLDEEPTDMRRPRPGFNPTQMDPMTADQMEASRRAIADAQFQQQAPGVASTAFEFTGLPTMHRGVADIDQGIRTGNAMQGLGGLGQVVLGAMPFGSGKLAAGALSALPGAARYAEKAGNMTGVSGFAARRVPPAVGIVGAVEGTKAAVNAGTANAQTSMEAPPPLGIGAKPVQEFLRSKGYAIEADGVFGTISQSAYADYDNKYKAFVAEQNSPTRQLEREADARFKMSEAARAQAEIVEQANNRLLAEKSRRASILTDADQRHADRAQTLGQQITKFGQDNIGNAIMVGSAMLGAKGLIQIPKARSIAGQIDNQAATLTAKKALTDAERKAFVKTYDKTVRGRPVLDTLGTAGAYGGLGAEMYLAGEYLNKARSEYNNALKAFEEGQNSSDGGKEKELADRVAKAKADVNKWENLQGAGLHGMGYLTAGKMGAAAVGKPKPGADALNARNRFANELALKGKPNLRIGPVGPNPPPPPPNQPGGGLAPVPGQGQGPAFPQGGLGRGQNAPGGGPGPGGGPNPNPSPGSNQNNTNRHQGGGKPSIKPSSVIDSVRDRFVDNNGKLTSKDWQELAPGITDKKKANMIEKLERQLSKAGGVDVLRRMKGELRGVAGAGAAGAAAYQIPIGELLGDEDVY